ncbi:hypothetical protein [Pararhizobium sp.]|uniref:hypothetical protein n=1 Tax=Pararhizobium sp. TaxID=1977563 RepID=UPI003D15202B
MATKKNPDPLLGGAQIDVDELAPHEFPDDDGSAPITKREAAKIRLVSVKHASALLNRSRGTVEKWLDNGCPYVTKGDKKLGLPWQLDLSEIVKWLEERSATVTAEKFGSTVDGSTSIEEAKRRRQVALMHLDEKEAEESLRSFVRWRPVYECVSNLLSEIRSGLELVPDAIAGRVDAKIAPRVRKIADEQIRTVLESLKIENVVPPPPAGE